MRRKKNKNKKNNELKEKKEDRKSIFNNYKHKVLILNDLFPL